MLLLFAAADISQVLLAVMVPSAADQFVHPIPFLTSFFILHYNLL